MITPLIADADNQKLRGGYYTPEVIARFLANWAIQSADEEILEPSCGDGALLADRLGMEHAEIVLLRQAWRKLSGRRMGRKAKAAKSREQS